MIRINLLPHREEKRRLRQKQFAAFAGITIAFGLVVAFVIWFFLDQQVQQQQTNVAYMKNEISKLDKQIEEIRKIREETAGLLAKKQVVEGLQSNRSEPVQLLDQLLRQLPEGVYLKSVKQVGTKVGVTGYAQSNARVSTLMRNIESSPWLANPGLVEVKAASVDKRRVAEFNLYFDVKRPEAKDDKAPAKPPAKPAATKG